jgi:hypothetical protein
VQREEKGRRKTLRADSRRDTSVDVNECIRRCVRSAHSPSGTWQNFGRCCAASDELMHGLCKSVFECASFSWLTT